MHEEQNEHTTPPRNFHRLRNWILAGLCLAGGRGIADIAVVQTLHISDSTQVVCAFPFPIAADELTALLKAQGGNRKWTFHMWNAVEQK